MRTAVDLDQLTKPLPPVAQLEHAPHPPPLRTPQAKPDLHLPQRLSRHLDALQLQQLLRRQRRAKALILLPQQCFDPRPVNLFQPTVRGAPTLARYPTRSALGAPGAHQTLELTNTKAKPFRCFALAHTPLDIPPHKVQTLALPNAHRNNRRPPQRPHINASQKGTFLPGPEGTFLLGVTHPLTRHDKTPRLR